MQKFKLYMYYVITIYCLLLSLFYFLAGEQGLFAAYILAFAGWTNSDFRNE